MFEGRVIAVKFYFIKPNFPQDQIFPQDLLKKMIVQ